MSANTWKKEHYPIPAADAAKGTNLQAVQHSLAKWRGLRPEALAKHKLVNRQGDIIYKGDAVIIMGDTSCSLCHKHDTWFGSCASCPLSRVRNQTRCDRAKAKEDESPWSAWAFRYDPEPMIAQLEKAEARLLKDQARKRK